VRERSSEALISKGIKPQCFAITFAIVVLPYPGPPCNNNNPFGLFIFVCYVL
jgi:hypothetical protein